MTKLKVRFAIKISYPVVLVTLAFLVGCISRKSTGPVYIGPFSMKDYFPLGQGYQWFWEVRVDSTGGEPFEDGDVNLGEPFVDLNMNGSYDQGEPYIDSNSNGKFDGSDDPWSEGVPYIDRNDNGQYDAPNGKWDESEFFVDLDSNGWFSRSSKSHLKWWMSKEPAVSGDGSTLFLRQCSFYGGPPGWSFVMTFNDDLFTNDSLGLRWHSHITGSVFSPEDDLKDHGPIIMAKPTMDVGDTVVYADTSDAQEIRSWISVLSAMEDVTVNAGRFRHCLKFESVAQGWTGNMQEYNGISHQWYAKRVGLVKLERPADGVHWQLDSAAVGGRSYP